LTATKEQQSASALTSASTLASILVLQLTAVPCSYFQLPAATCGYLRPRQWLLLLTRRNIEIALQKIIVYTLKIC
jgi:hypothetical protein